ncbi:PIG-L deacetylase family protein [Brachybacterium sp. UMB0905]|uniref:PIG-L deacetylase family protein n=1 Tax=Brachybacterium sp. UMB0905 TaxID=2069310 RepID=UPI000C7FF1D9|nr:PIG-L deacetylase family protein [Brachybacterium sp. UMB0905]PMC75436.1 GlcNAc-PI de-N-acetylase [Brachybacterium sp. UMB0905]
MTPERTSQILPPLPEDGVQRVLCVVAHPDDMEYGASAAVAAWSDAGVEVTYLLATRGEAGMADPPEQIAPLREREQRAACECVGVTDLRYLDHPDGMVEAGLTLRRGIARVIRQVRPQLVLATNFEVEAYGSLNQADHRAVGLAAADACRDAGNPWVFRELRESEGLEAWNPRALLIAGHPEPTHAKVVGPQEVQASIDSLRSHAAYLEHVTGHPEPEELIGSALRAGGKVAGADHAVVLRVIDLGGLRDDDA